MENLVGKRFGRLVVISYVGLLGGGQKLKYGVHKGYHTWQCQCDCGNVSNVRQVKLNAGHTKSCGCYKRETYKYRCLPLGEAAKNLLYSQYKESARRRDLTFSLEKDKFVELTSSNCHYCDATPKKSVAKRQKGNSKGRSLNGDYLYNGLDRKDNNIGYIEGNCLPCCWICNELKKDKSYDEFIAHIKKIATKQWNLV